jgi:hypothetical protein
LYTITPDIAKLADKENRSWYHRQTIGQGQHSSHDMGSIFETFQLQNNCRILSRGHDALHQPDKAVHDG